jgi:hypothetical protein
MMRHNILFILLAFFVSGVANAQHANFNSQKNWSLQKHELQFGLGATQFLGDLGGSPDIGKSNSLKDINFKSTGVAAWFGYRMRFHPKFATTSSLCLFTLKGDDAHSDNIIRNTRNLHFNAFCLEMQQRIEYILFSKEQYSPKYNFPGVRQAKNRNHQTYLFTGLGMIAFSSRAKYNGEWVPLRPLNTEGQGDVIDNYSPITLTVPFGLGMRFGINSLWRVGFEVSYVKTFSDYIDDVSTSYYEQPTNASAQAVALSNPSGPGTDPTWFAPGEQRGDPNDKDAYFHLNFIITRNLTYKDYGKQRQKVEKRLGKYKI